MSDQQNHLLGTQKIDSPTCSLAIDVWRMYRLFIAPWNWSTFKKLLQPCDSEVLDRIDKRAGLTRGSDRGQRRQGCPLKFKKKSSPNSLQMFESKWEPTTVLPIQNYSLKRHFSLWELTLKQKKEIRRWKRMVWPPPTNASIAIRLAKTSVR